MNELELIATLTRDLPGNATVVVGPGDDCAVLEVGLPDRHLLFKTDAVVEGVHFLPDTPAEAVGHKALARCLSDIAAMAGTPSSALITLGLPPAFDPERIRRLYEGLNRLARQHHVAVVGGETTTNPGALLVSIALLGFVAKDRCVRRQGAQPGDALWVTGDLGGSMAGKHLDFQPRLEEARWLADHFLPRAMLDLSDGLATDLRHLLRPDNLGAELLATAIPISRAARRRARAESSNRPPLLAALADGEDFELLFTTPSGVAVALRDAWAAQFPQVRLQCIGKITRTPGIRLRDANGVRTLTEHGYEHFA